jgi:hypothetical protein
MEGGIGDLIKNIDKTICYKIEKAGTAVAILIGGTASEG